MLQVQDKILRTFPEVDTVFGTVGRGTTPTDNTPMGMVNTTVTLKSRDAWRPGMTLDTLQAQMDAALQFPGFPNVWTQPIRNRLDMLLTGIKTPVGIKILGPDLETLNSLTGRVAAAVTSIPGTVSAYPERAMGGYYLDIVPVRETHALRELLAARRRPCEAKVYGGVGHCFFHRTFPVALSTAVNQPRAWSFGSGTTAPP